MSNRKRRIDKFVKVPLWWAEHAAKATRTPKAMVWVWLAYLAWEQGSNTFKLPNGRLQIRGVGRHAKARALRQLEKAGLIRVDRSGTKSPVVTLIIL
jgi:hypothetical protein